MLAGVSRSSYWLWCAFPPATARLNPPKDLNYKKQEAITAESVTLLKIPKFFALYSSKYRFQVRLLARSRRLQRAGECDDRIQSDFMNIHTNYLGDGL